MRTLGALVGAALALTLVACGSDDEPGPTGGTDPSGDRNEADEIYVEITSGSAGSLRQIAELADESADSEELRDLAEEIVDELGDVGDRLDDLADEWDLPEIVYGSVGSLPAQEQSEDWQRLQELEGPEFDALWVDVAGGSLDAIMSSAQTVIDRGTNAGLRELAADLLEDGEDWSADLAQLPI